MAYCVECDEQYSDKRLALGYRTCLECGRKDAIREARQKAKRTAPLYNKGGYMYLSDETDLSSISKKI